MLTRPPTIPRVLFGLLLCLATDMAMGDVVTAPTLEQLIQSPVESPDTTVGNIPPGRYEALKETALSYGMLAGLAFQYQNINKRLDGISSQMDKTYPFQALMMEGNVVPPVMSEADTVYDLQSPTKLRLSDKEYAMLSQPQFAYSPPTWKTYFAHEFSFDAHPAIGPKNDDEMVVWKKLVGDGYKKGMDQAEKIFENDAARLARDFNGMALYRQLLAAGKVTKPYVSVMHTAVTGNKKSSLKEGESFLQISATPEFVMNPTQWRVPLPSNIQDRIRLLADPVKGAEALRHIHIATETDHVQEGGQQ